MADYGDLRARYNGFLTRTPFLEKKENLYSNNINSFTGDGIFSISSSGIEFTKGEYVRPFLFQEFCLYLVRDTSLGTGESVTIFFTLANGKKLELKEEGALDKYVLIYVYRKWLVVSMSNDGKEWQDGKGISLDADITGQGFKIESETSLVLKDYYVTHPFTTISGPFPDGAKVDVNFVSKQNTIFLKKEYFFINGVVEIFNKYSCWDSFSYLRFICTLEDTRGHFNFHDYHINGAGYCLGAFCKIEYLDQMSETNPIFSGKNEIDFRVVNTSGSETFVLLSSYKIEVNPLTPGGQKPLIALRGSEDYHEFLTIKDEEANKTNYFTIKIPPSFSHSDYMIILTPID